VLSFENTTKIAEFSLKALFTAAGAQPQQDTIRLRSCGLGAPCMQYPPPWPVLHVPRRLLVSPLISVVLGGCESAW